jgi:hypothetical protein
LAPPQAAVQQLLPGVFRRCRLRLPARHPAAWFAGVLLRRRSLRLHDSNEKSVRSQTRSGTDSPTQRLPTFASPETKAPWEARPLHSTRPSRVFARSGRATRELRTLSLVAITLAHYCWTT